MVFPDTLSALRDGENVYTASSQFVQMDGKSY
jgi:hypothetical protein